MRLQGLAQYDDIEGPGRIGFQISVGVALNDRQTVTDTGVDTRLAQLDAAAVDALLPRQIGQQCPVAATDVEHTRPGFDHLGDQPQILAQLSRGARPHRRARGRAET
jgi:hypothetical protein